MTNKEYKWGISKNRRKRFKARQSLSNWKAYRKSQYQIPKNN